MSTFIFSRLQIHDRERYDAYMAAAGPIFVREGVKIHAADDAPIALTPDAQCDKAVLLEFRDDAHIQSFFTIPEYIKAAKDRDASTTMSTTKFESYEGVGNTAE